MTRAGIGLRAPHHAEFLARRPDLDWVEVHSENHFADGGPQLAVLDAVRRDYAVSLHGVGLSLGSTDPLDTGHLRRLQRLVARCDPVLVSEHLSFSSHGGLFLNDLLPLPHTDATVRHLASRIGQVQDTLGRQILVENISTYLRPPGDEMPEWEFVAAVARQAGCGLLLDLNNIFVNAVNHGFDAHAYLAAVPRDAVAEIHLAGHSVVEGLRIDTHSTPVCPEVWALYRSSRVHLGAVPTLIEWDAELPPLERLLAEAAAADAVT
jgi:hypothetical protein